MVHKLTGVTDEEWVERHGKAIDAVEAIAIDTELGAKAKRKVEAHIVQAREYLTLFTNAQDEFAKVTYSNLVLMHREMAEIWLVVIPKEATHG